MTKRSIPHIVALITAVALTFVIVTGCSDGSDGAADALSEFVYMPEAVRLPEGIGMVFANGVAVAEDRIFIAASASSLNKHTGEYSTHFELYSRMFDRSTFHRMLKYVPPRALVQEASGWSRIDAICADNDGNLWISEVWQFGGYDLPDGFDPERDNLDDYEYIDYGSGTALRKLDNEGAELLSVDLSGISGNRENFLIQSLNTDGAGNIYMTVLGSSTIFVFDDTGNLLFQLDAGGRQADRLIRMPDGVLAFMDSSGISGQILRTIDADARVLGDSVNIPGIGIDARIYSGGGEFDLLASDTDSLYGLIIGEEELVKLLDWGDIELHIELSNDSMEEGIAVLPDGRMMRISNAFDLWSGGFKAELVLLTATPRSELPDIPEKTVLTLATLNARGIRDLVMQFNRASPDYRIEVTDYSEGVGWAAGLTRLNTEIISGKIPDILDVTNMPYIQYVSKGLLVDLYPLIDSDPEINRDDFVESALRAAEIDGGLYTAFPFYIVRAIIGHPSVIGTGLRWTLDEFKSVIDAHPDADLPFGQFSKHAFLQLAISFDIDEYIDWGKGTVSFDSEQFISLLEYANIFSNEHDPGFNPIELIRSCRQIMAYDNFSGLTDFQFHRYMFGGEVAAKGFPARSSSGISIAAYTMFAITADSENQDGAWAFIRSFFGQDRQPSLFAPGFPTNKAAFDAYIENDIYNSQFPESGGTISFGDGSKYSIDYEPITQEQVGLLMSMLDAAAIMTTRTGYFDHIGLDVWNIISEGASDYFNGACSAEEAAKVIQSRASILVAEQS